MAKFCCLALETAEPVMVKTSTIRPGKPQELEAIDWNNHSVALSWYPPFDAKGKFDCQCHS